MYPRNAASPERIAVGAVVQISDGAVQTSGVVITVRGQGGAEGTGGGTTVYGASGIVYYTPLQAETNFTSFVVIGSKTGCIPVAQTIVTTASATAGQVVPEDGAITAAKFAAASLNGKGDWNIGKTGYSLTAATGLGNQTADITGNLSGSVGSVTGAVGSVTAAVTVGTINANVVNASALAADAVTEIASAVLSAAQTTPIHSDVRKVYNIAIDGAGTEVDPWGPA